MTPLVIDASATAPYLFEDEEGDQIAEITEAALEGRCLAPSLWPFEVSNLLWKAQRAKRISDDQLVRIRGFLQKLEVVVDTIAPEHIWGDVLGIAIRHGLTAYDATYLELAIRGGGQLASLDARLRRAALTEGIEIHPAP